MIDGRHSLSAERDRRASVRRATGPRVNVDEVVVVDVVVVVVVVVDGNGIVDVLVIR
jgi:hypothetical protein